jgi:hypothetical protein
MRLFAWVGDGEERGAQNKQKTARKEVTNIQPCVSFPQPLPCKFLVGSFSVCRPALPGEVMYQCRCLDVRETQPPACFNPSFHSRGNRGVSLTPLLGCTSMPCSWAEWCGRVERALDLRVRGFSLPEPQFPHQMGTILPSRPMELFKNQVGQFKSKHFAGEKANCRLKFPLLVLLKVAQQVSSSPLFS